MQRPVPHRARRFGLSPGRRAAVRRLLSRPPQRSTAAVLVLLVLVVGVASARTGAVPLTSVVPLVLVGALLLRLTPVLVLAAATVLALLASILLRADHRGPVTPSLVVVIVLTTLMAVQFARGREQLGLTGYLGEAMLVDLRDRLLAQGRLPALPPGWHAEGLVRPAHGDAFSGDVLLSCREGERLEVALVDVSGKGQDAGSRGLLLSGALGGLLGAVPAREFLPAANRYVLRQGWFEGFATAVHVAVDLTSGTVSVASAGHPPAVHAHGATEAELLETTPGPPLGLVPSAAFPAVDAVLAPGDALLVYSDGVVEQRDVDLGDGIGALVTRLLSLAPGAREGALAGLVDDVAPGEADDRTALLLWRDAA